MKNIAIPLLGLLCFTMNAIASNTTIPYVQKLPIANAGKDITIYSTQASSVTLDGSLSSGDSYLWTKLYDIAPPQVINPENPAVIMNPTSKVATVKGLIQGTWYFQIAVTSSGITKKDTVIIFVEYDVPPAGFKLVIDLPINHPKFVDIVNNRKDTSEIHGYDPYPDHLTSFYDSTVPGRLYIERSRANGATIDSSRGKLYSTIEDGYGWNNAKSASGLPYARTQYNYGESFPLDSNRTYIIEWRFYLPQNVSEYWKKENYEWNGVAIFGIHGDDDEGGAVGLRLMRDSLVVTDMPEFGPLKAIISGTKHDSVGIPRTIQITIREGDGYLGQNAFVEIRVDGKLRHSRYSGKVGKTLQRDYLKIPGLYDYGRVLVHPDSLKRNKKFTIVTESFKIYEKKQDLEPPFVNAGGDKLYYKTNTERFIANGYFSNAETYQWRKLTPNDPAIIDSPNSKRTLIRKMALGTWQYELAATRIGITRKDTITVVLLPSPSMNAAPIVKQIGDVVLPSPAQSVVLNGVAYDPDGQIVSYKWSKKSGPSGYQILNTKAASTEIRGLTEGIYQFELVVTDDKAATGSTIATVIVQPPSNIPPKVSAGPEQTIKLPTNSVSLNGSATDEDGTIVTYTWGKISGPAAFKIENPNSAATIVSGLEAGTYRFALTATDDKGATGSDTVKVIVVEEVNKSPKAIVENDIQITLPVDSAWLTGSGTDEDGSVVAFNWTKFSGPENFKLLNPDSAMTLVTGLTEGVYAFQLEVTDDKGATGMAILNVTVLPHSQNKPVADAGSDLYVTLPQDSVRLTGIGQSADAEIVTYNWTKKSGPPEFKIIDPDSSVTDITMLSEGVYEFWFEVTDSKGNTAIDSVKVTVSQSTNKAPVAIPGENQSITLPDSHIYLNGSGYDEDGTITSYRWTHVSGPNTFIIENPDSSYTKVSNLVPGNYQFELTVTDNEGATGSARISISVNPSINKAPIVHAGKDQTITLPVDSVYLIGSGFDEDGEIIQFQWTKISGPSSHFIQSPTDSATQINNLLAGIYQFRLTATDDQGAVGYDIVKITVNAQTNKTPEAIVEKDMNITLPLDSVILRGSGYDEDGEIVSYKWTKVSGPQSYILSDSLRATTTVTGLEEGTYRFQLEVMDDKGAIGIAVIMVTVNRAPNKPPLANAGAEVQITLPKNSVKLTGKGYDEDGEIVSYGWTKKSGPAKFTIVTPEAATTDITNLTEGIYEFRLEVIDNEGAASTDIVKVTVNPAVNKAPTANAGPDQTLTLPINSVQLTGSGKDEDGSIVKYKWVKKSGPASVVIKNADAATTLVTGLVQGVYQFEFIVTDDKGATGSAIVKITVNPIPNKPPKANAGKDQSITLPENSVILSGSGTDEDGTIRSYNWSKISGPASFKIEKPSSPETRVTNLVAGVYQFRLAVQDNDGATGTAIVKITVIKEPNKAPIAFAGNDQVITLPANSVKLTGTASDEDGTLVDYKWTKISGPSTYKFMDPGSLITDVTGLTEGVYQFELKVTDNEGASGLSMVKITVKPKPNKPPVANAGKNATITLPNNTVSLSGSGSDEDGKVVSYQWTKKSGPSQFRIVNAKSPVTDVTELVEGVYIFELTVTDDRGAKGAAAVTITVKANPIKPIADAGEDITIVWPQNSATLSGSGHSLNGKIIKYQWRQISGPSIAILQFPDSSRTMVNELISGYYSFAFTVMDQKNMTATDTMYLTVAAARLDTRKSEINIYPNPVGDFTMLDISGVDPNQKLSILVSDLGGKVVLRKDIVSSGSSSHKERIDFTNQPAGMYIVTLHSAEGVIITSKKIIKSE